MKPEPAARASLCAVLRHDRETLQRLDAQLAPLLPELAPGRGTFRDWAAAGYLLHSLYNALENSFEQISRTFENHVVDAARWHRELLDKMFLAIPGVRPAVLASSLRPLLHDLRGFRHLFRHGYDLDLDPARLARLAQQWNSGKDELLTALQTFSDWLLAGGWSV